MQQLTTKNLVLHLKSKQPKDAGFLDKLKIVYRPYICPFDELLEQIPSQSSVFDIGCGSGMFLSLVKEFRNPKKLGGCEIAPHLVKNTKALLQGFSGVEIFEFNGTVIPKQISSYDFVSMIDVFHHIPKEHQLAFMRNLIDLMKPGATLIFKDIKNESPLVLWNKVHDLLLAGEIGNEINSSEIEQHLTEKLGLTLISKSSKRMLLYPHFTLILKKKS